MERCFLKYVDAQNLQNPAEIFAESMNLIETGHHEVNADSDPDLGFYRVLGGAVERFYSEILLNPFKEEFDMPTALVDSSDGHCGQSEVIGDKDQAFARFWIDNADASEFCKVIPFALGGLQTDNLVATQTNGLVDRSGLADIESHVALGPRDEECSGLMNAMESCEIDVSTIHDIDASRFENNLVEHVHVVDTPVGNAHKHWDGAFQVDHPVQLDCGFGLSEMRPWEHGKAQVDCRGIKRVNHFVDVQSVGIFGIQSTGFANQYLPDSFVDAPIPILVRIGEIGPDDLPANTHRIAMGATIQTRFDIPQTLPEGNLGEGHREKLIASAHTLARPWHRVQSDTALELLAIQHIENLGKNEASGVHSLLRMNSANDGQRVQMRDTPFCSLDA